MAKRKNPPRAKRSGQLKAGKLHLDLETRSLRRGKRVQQLTPKECTLLEVFMNNGGEVLTRKFLMKHVWETDYLGDTRTLDVHIRWLRQKIENNPSEPVLLRTVRGVGYRFEIPRRGKKKE
jgi:DNA-binding response OmpR family regulator